MKLNEFWVQLFGSDDSKVEFEQLDKWKTDGELNAHKLQEMVAINKEANQLQSYQAFDMEAAFAATMSTIETETPEPKTKTSFPAYLYWIIGLLSLGLAGLAYTMYSSNTNTSIQYAEGYEMYNKEDGSSFVIKEGSVFTSDDSTNKYSLRGEAFFDVEKQNSPMTIETKHGTIKVLGTSFNVNSTSDLTEIFMFSGVIEFTNLQGEVTLVKKGQCILSDDKHDSLMNNMSSQVYAFWRTHKLDYKNANLSNVLQDLNRLYEQNLNSSSKEFENVRITANFQDSSLEEIISELEVITKLDLK